MKRPKSVRLALAVLERFAPDSEALSGDVIEEYEGGRSSTWLWREVLAAVIAAWRQGGDEIRPLKLVDIQPADAIERTRRMRLRVVPVNLTGSPVPGVGGLGLVALGLIVLYARGVIHAL
jgi:hypothetical protein